MTEETRWRWHLGAGTRPYVAVFLALAFLGFLARYKVWPFGTAATLPQQGQDASVFEVLLTDRLMIGFIRAGIVSVVCYVVVSVPALIISRRWMKGLSTAGLTADDADSANETIEELQEQLETAQAELESELIQADLREQLILRLQSAGHREDNGDEEGGA